MKIIVRHVKWKVRSQWSLCILSLKGCSGVSGLCILFHCSVDILKRVVFKQHKTWPPLLRTSHNVSNISKAHLHSCTPQQGRASDESEKLQLVLQWKDYPIVQVIISLSWRSSSSTQTSSFFYWLSSLRRDQSAYCAVRASLFQTHPDLVLWAAYIPLCLLDWG
jgi:hypothetical protein